MYKYKKDLFFIITIVFLHLIFFSIAVYQDNYFTFNGNNFKIFDSYQYLIEAKNIIEHSIFYCGDLKQSINFDFYTMRPPIYPLFLSIFYLFKAPLFVIIFFQNTISVASIYFVRKTLLLFNYQKKYDLIFLIILILTPSQFIYANTIMAEVLFQFFIVMMFRNVILFINYKEKKYLLWYSFMLVFAAFVKPVMYLFVFPSLMFMLFLSLKLKKWYPSVISLIPIIAVLLMFVWNHHRTNQYQYSSIQTVNLLNYNSRLFLLSTKGSDYSERVIDSIHQAADQISDYAKKTTYLNQASRYILTNNWVDYGFYHLQRSALTFFDPGRFDIANFFKIETKKLNSKGILFHLNNGGVISVLKFLINTYSISLLLILGLILVFNIVKLIGLILFAFNQKIDLNIRIFVTCLIMYIALLAGPVGASRYLMPFAPIIIGVILIDNIFLQKIPFLRNKTSNA